MKPAVQLIVTVLLVAGGIFVYDAMVVRAPAPEADVIERSETRADEPADDEEAIEVPSLAVLEGTGDDIWRADVDRRLAELEQIRVAAVADDPSTAGLVPGLGDAGAAEVAGDAEAGEPLDPEERKRIQRERLKWFRGMLETVERQRRWEQAARKVRQYIDKLDLALTDEQKSNVVRTTVHYQGRWKQLTRNPAQTDEAKQERRDAYQVLWNEYETSLRNVIPSSEADVIVQSIQQASSRRKDAR